MTESTLPAARPRRILTQIAPVAWEHPADRAALQSLRAVPGFDEVVKKIFGFIGERGVRLIFQAGDGAESHVRAERVGIIATSNAEIG